MRNNPWFRQMIPALVVAGALGAMACGEEGSPAKATSSHAASRVYGEWRIRVKPDRGEAYARLIETSGLPLFREAGGRMVGWWKTLVGDLYEQMTLWEYDDMAAFERAIGFLSKSPAFATFVAARDPLLAGEESRFLRLATGAARPNLGDPAPFVIHEIHRVPLSRRQAYLDFMTRRGLELLKAHGFHPVGPFVADVGRWSEVTLIFRFESLAERERLIARFSENADAGEYGGKIGELTEDVSTRLLVPAPFSSPARSPSSAAMKPSASSDAPPLPLRATIAAGVHAAGFADRFDSANCGWVELSDEVLLIDLPRGLPIAEFLSIARSTSGKPARTLLLTHARPGDAAILRTFIEQGITRVVVSPETRSLLDAPESGVDTRLFQVVGRRGPVIGPDLGIEFLPLDEAACRGGAAVYVRGQSVLFAGPLVAHGRRAALDDSDTSCWLERLRLLESLGARHVVPGSGSWGGPGLLARQRRYLGELRRQVAYHIAQGRPLPGLYEQVRIPTSDLVAMPYDNPTREDVEHVYRELTVPFAPFGSNKPSATDDPPHAMVLIGDQPHEPGHIEEGLRPAFEAAGVVPHFAVDVRALSAENLARVRLLVILRDGLQRPSADPRDNFAWMTPEQGQALAAFVESGGGMLGLHNALGLYPAESPYLRVMAGRYTTHGPLERFRVEVVDPDHEITRGVRAYFAADEQHTPICDEGRAHVLLRSRSDDGKTAPAGWVRDQGRGRVCHLAGGHTREALLHPMYQKLLRNALRWCLRPRGEADQDPGA